MKKMIYIANIRLPTEKAHGIQIMKTCEALAAQGIVVELLIPNRVNLITANPFVFYAVKPNFTITTLPCWDLISNNRLGVLGYWLQSWTFYRSVRKYLKKHVADVYYTRDFPIVYWLGKKVYTLFYEVHTLPDVISFFHKHVWQRAKGLIVISGGLRDRLVNEGVAGKKLFVARDAVDVQQFQVHESKRVCRNTLLLPQDQIIILYTGHLYEWKGAHLLAEAASFLPQDMHVYIVGGTVADVAQFQKKYTTPKLHVIGYQPHDRIPYWLRAADVLVIPNSKKETRSALYTSPMKLFEYMASGTPMVLSDLPSLREVVGEHGVFFDPDDASALAAAIVGVCTQTEKAAQYAAWAKDEVLHYSWRERARLIQKFVCDL